MNNNTPTSKTFCLDNITAMLEKFSPNKCPCLDPTVITTVFFSRSMYNSIRNFRIYFLFSTFILRLEERSEEETRVLYVESSEACNELIPFSVSSSHLIYYNKLTLRESYTLSETVEGGNTRTSRGWCFSLRFSRFSNFSSVPEVVQIEAGNMRTCVVV